MTIEQHVEKWEDAVKNFSPVKRANSLMVFIQTYADYVSGSRPDVLYTSQGDL